MNCSTYFLEGATTADIGDSRINISIAGLGIFAQ
jgi:hypothetical protein